MAKPVTPSSVHLPIQIVLSTEWSRGTIRARFAACRLKCASSNLSQVLIERSQWISVNHSHWTVSKVFFFHRITVPAPLEPLFSLTGYQHHYKLVHNVFGQRRSCIAQSAQKNNLSSPKRIKKKKEKGKKKLRGHTVF